MRRQLTPCLICEKSMMYLWPDKENASNVSHGCDITINGHYGSHFDSLEYDAFICDDCLDKAIQSKRVTFVKENPMF